MHTNRLTHIDDTQTNAAAYIGDLEDQEPNNYTYDRIGNLESDDRDSITHIAWTTSQKIDTILKTDRYHRFTYNPMQQRVVKYTGVNGSDAETRTYYVRDAQGNVMAVYRMWMHLEETVPVYDSLKLTEWHIYGSSRVGLLQSNLDLIPAVESKQAVVQVIKTGMKRYELSNHLGNVLAVITDRKRGRSASGSGAVQWYEADVLSAQQYFPFGMLMPGHAGANLRRQYTLGGYDYRYGFNGKEGDDEVKGDDNQQDYGMRIYDPRAGRFLSVDPISREYPWYTPYQFAGNMPILAVDLDGLEPLKFDEVDKYYTRVTTNEGITIFTDKATKKQFNFDHRGTKTKLGVYFELDHPQDVENTATTFRYQISKAFSYDLARDLTKISTPSTKDQAVVLDNAAGAVSSSEIGKEFRHIALQAYLTIKFSEKDAKTFGDFYERYTESEENDRSFDLINNQRGRDLGNSIKKEVDLSKKEDVVKMLNLVSDQVKTRYGKNKEGQSPVFNTSTPGVDSLTIEKK